MWSPWMSACLGERPSPTGRPSTPYTAPAPDGGSVRVSRASTHLLAASQPRQLLACGHLPRAERVAVDDQEVPAPRTGGRNVLGRAHPQAVT